MKLYQKTIYLGPHEDPLTVFVDNDSWETGDRKVRSTYGPPIIGPIILNTDPGNKGVAILLDGLREEDKRAYGMFYNIREERVFVPSQEHWNHLWEKDAILGFFFRDREGEHGEWCDYLPRYNPPGVLYDEKAGRITLTKK